LKNQYLSLYHENERFQGPTPMAAILIFGGRQWSSKSLFPYERDHLSSKKSNSVKKTWSNLGLKRRNKFEQVCDKLKRTIACLFRPLKAELVSVTGLVSSRPVTRPVKSVRRIYMLIVYNTF